MKFSLIMHLNIDIIYCDNTYMELNWIC